MQKRARKSSQYWKNDSILKMAKNGDQVKAIDFLKSSLWLKNCARCCVRLHLFRQYRSSLLNSPGGGSTSLVFPVSSILGDNGGAESGSLRVSTVRDLLLILYSALQRKVLNDSSSRRLPCSLMRPFMTLLIDLICLSQTPPKLLAHAGFLIQSMFGEWYRSS